MIRFSLLEHSVDVLRNNTADMVPTNIMGNAFKVAGRVEMLYNHFWRMENIKPPKRKT